MLNSRHKGEVGLDLVPDAVVVGVVEVGRSFAECVPQVTFVQDFDHAHQSLYDSMYLVGRLV